MWRVDRRTFLRMAAASSGASTLHAAGCGVDEALSPVPEGFPQGVASGDPAPDSVLLWTRVEATGAVGVRWEVASDEGFADVVASGETTTDGDRDHTVRVEVGGLSPGTHYWYRFFAEQVASPVGRTRTAPAPDADVPVRIALASCQDFGGRWFHAWRAALAYDVDLVLFIGDYIYETIGHLGVEPPADRRVELPDGLALDDPLKGTLGAETLEDYRALYRQYRSDPDLRAIHASVPFVTIWDDHEFANDCWQDHATDFDDRRGDEQSTARRRAATQAWYEHHPIRRPFDAAAGFPDDLSVQRALRWGRHAERRCTPTSRSADRRCTTTARIAPMSACRSGRAGSRSTCSRWDRGHCSLRGRGGRRPRRSLQCSPSLRCSDRTRSPRESSRAPDRRSVPPGSPCCCSRSGRARGTRCWGRRYRRRSRRCTTRNRSTRRRSTTTRRIHGSGRRSTPPGNR
jgi:hypothetical protein